MGGRSFCRLRRPWRSPTPPHPSHCTAIRFTTARRIRWSFGTRLCSAGGCSTPIALARADAFTAIGPVNEIRAVRVVDRLVVTFIVVPHAPSAIRQRAHRGIDDPVARQPKRFRVIPRTQVAAGEMNERARMIPILEHARWRFHRSPERRSSSLRGDFRDFVRRAKGEIQVLPQIEPLLW